MLDTRDIPIKSHWGVFTITNSGVPVKIVTNLAPVKFPTVALFVSFRNNPLTVKLLGDFSSMKIGVLLRLLQ
jgi:hypothetical protein